VKGLGVHIVLSEAIEKIRAFEVRTKFEDGLRTTIDWHLENRG